MRCSTCDCEVIIKGWNVVGQSHLCIMCEACAPTGGRIKMKWDASPFLIPEEGELLKWEDGLDDE